MIVYIGGHKQNLETEELLEAFNLCEEIGNDTFGQGHWFIEGKQRKIKDHFHWHVRELKMVNDILAVKLLNADPILDTPLVVAVPTLEQVKGISFETLKAQIKLDESQHSM